MLDLHVESFHDEAYEKREHVMSSSFGLKHLELSLSLRPLVVENEAGAVSVAMALDFYCHGFCSVSSKERTRGHHRLFFAAQHCKRKYILYSKSSNSVHFCAKNTSHYSKSHCLNLY